MAVVARVQRVNTRSLLTFYTPQVEDMTDGATYSIEEAKQKTEEDNLLAAADSKKMSVREYLNKIRKEFESLLKQNESKPEAQRLSREEFEIDPGLRSMIEEEIAQKEEAARKELAWESEKAKLMLGKVCWSVCVQVAVGEVASFAWLAEHFRMGQDIMYVAIMVKSGSVFA